MDKDRFMTTGECARLLRYKSGKHVADLCREGKLPGVQVAGKWLIDRDRLYAMLDRPQPKPQPRIPTPRRYVSTGISERIKAM